MTDNDGIPAFQRIRVKRSQWLYGEGNKFPILRLVQARNSDGREYALFLPYEDARELVDRVHDACDEYESSQRDTEHPAQSTEGDIES